MKPVWTLIVVAAAVALVSSTVLRFFNSTSQRSLIDVSVYVLYIIGGIILLFVRLERTRIRSGWAQGVIVLAGLLLAFVGTAELLRHYRLWMPAPQIEHGFAYTLTLLQGTALGLFLATIFSGELAGRKIPK
jgi:peptidoglycan/LPS O-acetylase OafA/YrhL